MINGIILHYHGGQTLSQVKFLGIINGNSSFKVALQDLFYLEKMIGKIENMKQ